MKTSYKHLYVYTLNLPAMELKNIPEIFKVEPCGKNIEIHSGLAEKEDARNLLKILEHHPINSVSYIEMFFENIDLPKGFLKKKKLDKRKIPKKVLEEQKESIEEFDEKMLYSKLKKPLHLEENRELLSKILSLPRVKPERFATLCGLLKDKNSGESYYDENIKDYFPFHPEPYCFVSKGDITFSMFFHRSVLRTNKYFTNITVSAHYNPEKGDFLDKSVDLVQKSMNFLLSEKKKI